MMEDLLRSLLHAATTTPTQRAAIVHEMWKCGASGIAFRPKNSAARHLSQSLAPLPFLAVDPDLFSNPEEETIEQDKLLSEEFALDRTVELTPECIFTAEDIQGVRLSMKRNRTCGDDGVVPEMIVATSAADWEWAAAFESPTSQANPQESCAMMRATTSAPGCCRRWMHRRCPSCSDGLQS